MIKGGARRCGRCMPKPTRIRIHLTSGQTPGSSWASPQTVWSAPQIYYRGTLPAHNSPQAEMANQTNHKLFATSASAGGRCGFAPNGRKFNRQEGGGNMSLCRWCDNGDVPRLIDVDGKLSSISGKPGKLHHASGEYYWRCRNDIPFRRKVKGSVKLPTTTPNRKFMYHKLRNFQIASALAVALSKMCRLLHLTYWRFYET